MTAGPYEAGDTARVYAVAHQLFADRLSEVAALFIRNPNVQASSVEIRNGRIEIVAEGIAGCLKEWARAIPDHRTSTALVAASWGLTEADVLEADHVKVTVRRPLGIGGAQ